MGIFLYGQMRRPVRTTLVQNTGRMVGGQPAGDGHPAAHPSGVAVCPAVHRGGDPVCRAVGGAGGFHHQPGARHHGADHGDSAVHLAVPVDWKYLRRGIPEYAAGDLDVHFLPGDRTDTCVAIFAQSGFPLETCGNDIKRACVIPA